MTTESTDRDPLAAALLLQPSVTILVRRDGRVQLGWDPDHAVTLRPPPGVGSHAVLAILRMLDGSACRAEILAAAADNGVEAADGARMLAELDTAGLLCRPDRPAATRSIRVLGRGPLADAVMAGLCTLGMQAKLSTTYRSGTDVRSWHADFVVLTDNLIVDPELVDRLLAAGIAHLQVRIRDGRGIVGPLVVPGRTSCLRCADLTRCEYDAEWPFLAGQLFGQVGYARPAAVQATAAIALDQLQTALARGRHGRAAAENATIEFDLATLRIDTREWPPHLSCGCGPVEQAG